SSGYSGPVPAIIFGGVPSGFVASPSPANAAHEASSAATTQAFVISVLPVSARPVVRAADAHDVVHGVVARQPLAQPAVIGNLEAHLVAIHHHHGDARLVAGFVAQVDEMSGTRARVARGDPHAHVQPAERQ